jgi:hypothetical protein
LYVRVCAKFRPERESVQRKADRPLQWRRGLQAEILWPGEELLEGGWLQLPKPAEYAAEVFV